MQLTDLTPFALNALLLLATAGAGILVIIRRPKPVWLVILLAVACGGGFAILMNDRGLSWWGMLGDEAFIGAAITKAWHGIYWSDFYYTNLPPFYPPLYFWITGFVGRLIGLSPIGAMNAGVAGSLLLLPLTVYVGIRLLPQKLFPERGEAESKGCPSLPFDKLRVDLAQGRLSSGTNSAFQKYFAFFAAGTVLMVSEWIGFLSKPFEFLTAAIAILWVIHVAVESSRKAGLAAARSRGSCYTTLSRGLHLRLLILGIVGALLIWTYYFWMIFAIIAIALAGIKFAPGIRKQWYGRLTTIFSISAILSAPFWINLIRGALASGEAWQAHWFTIEELVLFPTLLHGLPALVALAGIGTLIAFRKKTIPFILGMTFLAPVLWFVMNLFTLLFAQTAFLPTKAMHFIGAYSLALAAAWAITSFWNMAKSRTTNPPKCHSELDSESTFYLNRRSRIKSGMTKGTLISTWILFVLSVPSGLFAYQFGNEHILSLSPPPLQGGARGGISKETKEVVDYLLTVKNLSNKTALVSEQPRIVGQAPINVFLSFNMHFTHPQARWSERYLIVHQLATAQTPEEFTDIARNNPFSPIDLLILTKNEKEVPPLSKGELGGVSEKKNLKSAILNLKSVYEVYSWRDNFPNGGYDQTISFPQSLVSKKQWGILFENKQFVVFEYLEPKQSIQPNQ